MSVNGTLHTDLELDLFLPYQINAIPIETNNFLKKKQQRRDMIQKNINFAKSPL